MMSGRAERREERKGVEQRGRVEGGKESRRGGGKRGERKREEER